MPCYDEPVRRLVLFVTLCAALAVPAAAQDDVIARARTAAAEGRRSEGLVLLAAHLATVPGDVDARLVYGLILSWDKQYEAARRELTRVLTEAPDYFDATVALMNVEWWSGRADEARRLMAQVLAREPGNEQARLVRQRLDARTRPWWVGVLYTHDSFDDDRAPWDETAIEIGRETPVGTAILRGSQASRFDQTDQQVEIDVYPLFRAGTYAYINVGVSPDHDLYPRHRYSAELFQSVGHGFELSAGYRAMAFDQRTDIASGQVTKYAGDWMLSARAEWVDDPLASSSWSYQGAARWYFGVEGRSYVGASYRHGLTKGDPRGEGDLVSLGADTVKGEVRADVGPSWRVQASVSGSRQERSTTLPLWQTTLFGGLAFRF